MPKTIDLDKTVFELVQENPELIDIMQSLGFSEIAKKPVLHSLGRIMTIPKGAEKKGIPLEKIIDTLQRHGFYVTENSSSENRDAQVEHLKSFLNRLSSGESLDAVRQDFARAFDEVDPLDIMLAEQSLINDGTPIAEMQKLCDLHSALFHGSTRQEHHTAAEKIFADAEKKNAQLPDRDDSNREQRAHELASLPGHPLYTLTKENEQLETILAQAKEGIDDAEKRMAFCKILRNVSIHYAKKGDLLYPNLSVRYGITGPSNVMWSVDDEIRDTLASLEKKAAHMVKSDFEAVLQRLEEMIYKEQNILFPICAASFTEDEWIGIYHDAKDYSTCFNVEAVEWEAAEHSQSLPESIQAAPEDVALPGGNMTIPQLSALLDTIPLEITFVDENNINRFFNNGPKVFKRPRMAIGRDVFSCHPPKIETMVRNIIEDFRSGTRDCVPIWMEKEGRSMLVTYRAVRDANGHYLGTMELVQDMEFAKKHFSEQHQTK